jgi:biotin transport system substrate-specific component
MYLSLAENPSYPKVKAVLQVLCGSIFMILASKISLFLPFTPVPLSFQTFAVILLGIALGGNRGAAAVALFLGYATCSLNVLATGFNPLWMVGPTAGYLLGFIAAAYCVGTLIEQKRNKLFSVMVGMVCIYLPGALWVSTFVGYENALRYGVWCFMPLEAVKSIALITISYMRKN